MPAVQSGGSIDRYNAAVSLMGSATAGLGIECPRVPRMLFTNECAAQTAVIAHQAVSVVASSFARAYDITLDDWATPAQQIHSDCAINLKQWADLCGDEPRLTWRDLLVRPAPGQPADSDPRPQWPPLHRRSLLRQLVRGADRGRNLAVLVNHEVQFVGRIEDKVRSDCAD